MARKRWDRRSDKIELDGWPVSRRECRYLGLEQRGRFELEPYQPPEKVEMNRYAFRSGRKILKRAIDEQLERFGVIEGEWRDGNIIIGSVKDQTEKYEKERGVHGFALKNDAARELMFEIRKARYEGKGIVGTFHTHFGGRVWSRIGKEEQDLNFFEQWPAGVGAIIYSAVLFQAPSIGIQVFHCAPEIGKVVKIFERDKPAKLPKKHIGFLRYEEQIYGSNPFD